MNNKLKYIISATLIGLSSLFFINRRTITYENLKVIEADVEHAIEETLDTFNFNNEAYFFAYYKDYSRRIYFVKGEEISLPDEDINSDIFFIQALELHKANLCMITNTEDIKPGIVRDAFEANDYIDPETWYISCPVFIDKTLIGYVSTVEKLDRGRVYPRVTQVRLIAHKIAGVLTSAL